MGRELQKWAEPPKWGEVSSHKNFHHWLWLQPIVIDLHFKMKLFKISMVSSCSKIKYANINILCESRAQRSWMEGPAFISLLLDPTEKRSGLMDTADEAPEGEETTARIRPEYHEGSIFRDPIRALFRHMEKTCTKHPRLLCECVSEDTLCITMTRRCPLAYFLSDLIFIFLSVLHDFFPFGCLCCWFLCW